MIKLNEKFFFNENGWCIIRNLFSKNELKKINDQLKIFLKKNFKKYSGRDINFAGKKKLLNQINSFHKLNDCNYFKKLSNKKKIISIPQTLLSSKKISLRASELFAKPARMGLAAPIHQDNYYWCVKDHKALTLWISFNKVSEKNGGVFYFNGSHKHGIFKHVPSYSKGSSQKIKNRKFLKKKFKTETPILNPGDCLVHHCLTVHGSNKNRSNFSRKGFTFQFKNFNSKYDETRKKKYENSLIKQLKLKRN